MKSGDLNIACRILLCRRSGELSPEYINKTWKDAISRGLFSLPIAMLQGPAAFHIPLATLKETLNLASERGQLELFLALQENRRLQSTFCEVAMHCLTQENGGITRALVSSVSQGHLPLTIAILESPLFRFIPREGYHSLNGAVKLAQHTKNIPILEALLSCSRTDEIYESHRFTASIIIAYEAAAPKNCLARFFWRLTHSSPYKVLGIF